MQQKDVEIARVHRVLASVSRFPELQSHVVICFGTTFASVTKSADVDVLHTAPGVTGAWRYVPLPKPKFFVARLRQSFIFEFFKSIDHYACVSFMIFPADEEGAIVEEAIAKRNPFDASVLNMPDHFVYYADIDNPESSTGICEACSIGADSPLRAVFPFL